MQTKTYYLIDTDHWNVYITFQTFIGAGFNFVVSKHGVDFAIVIPFTAIGMNYVNDKPL